ncbi:hypothetical protein PV341_30605 [Streptomyces sp. PA03-1a]|nr:hypothetical protein [Streptomyces sp. PA03-1a]
MVTAAAGRTSAARLIHEQRQEEPDVVRLAQSLSLAAQAEPYVVRAARLRFVPRSSAGLEAQLWFSPLVEAAGGLTMVLDPAVAAVLRRDLATNDRALLASVRSFTERAHHDAPLAVRTFETLLWAGTAQAVPAEGDIRRELEPFLAQVLSDGPEALEAGRWAIRHLPRLPDAVRDSAPARRLRIAAAERLGLELTPAAAGLLPEEVTAVRRMVHRDVDVGIRAEPGGIVLTRPPERDAQVCQVSGAARVRLRLRAALPGAAWHELDLHDRRRAAAPLDVVAAARLDGSLDGARAELGDVVRCVWAGEHGALAVSAAGRTEIRVDAAGRVLVADLPVPPDLLAVADAGPPRAAAAGGSGLQVVGAALDASGEVTAHPWSPAPTALGWAAPGGPGSGPAVLCVAEGRKVHLLDDGDPRRVVLTLDHPADVTHLWTSVSAALIAVADAEGRVVARHAAPGNGMVSRRFATGGSPVTALAGDPLTGDVVWATEDGRVWLARSPEDDARDPVPLGRLPRPATSLAVSSSDATVVAADGGRHLLRLRRPAAGDPEDPGSAPLPGARLPFQVREVFAAGRGRLMLTGTGGPVEIRSEDGRVHLVLPYPAAASTSASQAPGPGPSWLRASVGVALPGPGPEAPPEDVLRAARRCGIGHIRLSGPHPHDPRRTDLVVERAGEAGLRVVAGLPAPPPEAAPADVLLDAQRLLDARVDALLLEDLAAWPAHLLDDLRHLTDAYTGAGLIGIAGPGTTGGPEETAPRSAVHLTVGPAPLPRPGAWTVPLGTAWVLPDRPPADPGVLLALPGCHEVPAGLLTATGHRAEALRVLLSVRARQQALVHGSVDAALPEPVPGVTALWRRHGSEAILCLGNAGDAPVTVTVPAPPDGPELVGIATLGAAAGEPRPLSTVRPSAGGYTITVAPGATHWLSLWESTDPGWRPGA